MALEIERKFLLEKFPSEQIADGQLKIISEQEILQTYLAIDAEQELRVRKITDLKSEAVRYTHTFKKGKGLIREEIEYSISAGLYEKLMNQFTLKPLNKTRTTVTCVETEVMMEIDSYPLHPFIVIEVEFINPEEAHNFVPPDWFGPDISSNKQYSNKAIWRKLQKEH